MLQAALRRSPRSLLRCCNNPALSTMPLATKSQQAAHPDQEVLVSTSPAGLGRITLCRERQLNALGAHHVEALRTQLLQWSDPGAGIACVLLDSNNDRSFCSGGDVKAARQAVLDNPYADAPPPGHHIHRVFEAEYSTVLLIAAHPNLAVCCQGIWMGLGFGIAGYAPYRIISDGTIFAMPETAIGLWPDVGFAFKAAHMKDYAGLLLGLSGVRITSPSDLLHYGIATHFIPQDKLQDFKSDLAQKPTAVQQLLKQYGSGPPDTPGPLQQLMVVVAPHMQHLIDSWQAPGCEPLQALHKLIEQLQQEVHTLRSSDHQAAELLQHTINGITYASPRSLVITLQHFCRVHDAVTARVQLEQRQRGSASSSSSSSTDSSGGFLPLPAVTWSVDVTVDGRDAGSPPDLSTLQGTMQVEYRMAVHQVAHEDFIEGVRAALVDKDRRPAWLGSAGLVQHEHHVGVSGGHYELLSKQAGRQLPGNRFSVEHLFDAL